MESFTSYDLYFLLRFVNQFFLCKFFRLGKTCFNNWCFYYVLIALSIFLQ